MRKRKRNVFLAIARAASRGGGVRLSPDEAVAVFSACGVVCTNSLSPVAAERRGLGDLPEGLPCTAWASIDPVEDAIREDEIPIMHQ